MDSKSKSSTSQRVSDLSDASALWRSAFRQSEDWMKPNFEVLEDLHFASQNLITRRLEDFQKAVDAYRQMMGCKDFAQAAAIQQKWVADFTQRVVADWTALVGSAAKQSSRHGEETRKAAE
jgi:hypothetical protein